MNKNFKQNNHKINFEEENINCIKEIVKVVDFNFCVVEDKSHD